MHDINNQYGHIMDKFSPKALEQIAAYFKVLADPNRLQILSLLREGELNVGKLAERCSSTSANISRHLSILSQHGLITRKTQGTRAYYQLTDHSTYALCELVCENITQKINAQKDAFN